MYKEYIVVFQNLETGKCHLDIFAEVNEAKARKAFKECYRHGFYRIISVTEKPEVTPEVRKKYGLFGT